MRKVQSGWTMETRRTDSVWDASSALYMSLSSSRRREAASQIDRLVSTTDSTACSLREFCTYSHTPAPYSPSSPPVPASLFAHTLSTRSPSSFPAYPSFCFASSYCKLRAGKITNGNRLLQRMEEREEKSLSVRIPYSSQDIRCRFRTVRPAVLSSLLRFYRRREIRATDSPSNILSSSSFSIQHTLDHFSGTRHSLPHTHNFFTYLTFLLLPLDANLTT